MRVLFATPECAPLTKTGGLGDVSAALPAALRALGHDVRVLLPGYPAVLGALPQAHEAARLELLGEQARLLDAGELLLIDCPALYLRDGGPYQDAQGADWPDNPRRFGLLSRVAALLSGGASPLEWRPQVLHCNDWPCGLAPVYLSFETSRAAAVMTVHNLAFQGVFDPAWLRSLALPVATFSIEGVEFYGKLSFLKGGLAYADAITTVSPTYAREIQTEELGCGLDGLLRARRDALSGIANGIDTDAWDPQRDAHLAQTYGRWTLERKSANKEALQRRLGLAVDAGRPLLGTVCRFTEQKGIDLVAEAADELLALPAQLAILGTGERRYEEALGAAAARHAGSLGLVVGFDEALAHLIEAGADLFLMPSRFEPCGLNQMYSQRYGTLPVARSTGGLADTVSDGETGFLFQRATAAELAAAVRRALEVWRDARRWRDMQRRAMERDFSWAAPARQYAALYSRLARWQPA
ncbi:MAG TPA: glycogen synthase GlgA [Burkholderiales bacterium]